MRPEETRTGSARQLDGACGGPCSSDSCLPWCSDWSCMQDGCQGCGPDLGCIRPPPPSPPSPPPDPPHPPLGPDGCKFTYGNCLDAQQTCCSPLDGCFRRVGKMFAMCKPRVAFCRNSDDWLCPGWQESPPPPPPAWLVGHPPFASPALPPPIPGAVCAGFFQPCLELKCCVVSSQLCYKRIGKQFAMCKTIPSGHGQTVCDVDEWDCPERWVPSPPPPLPPATPAPPRIHHPRTPPSPTPPPAAPRDCAKPFDPCVEAQCCEDIEVRSPELPFSLALASADLRTALVR